MTPNESGFRYDSPYAGAGLDVRFVQPDQAQIESRAATTSFGIQEEVLRNWRRAHGTDAPREETITVTSAGPFAPTQDLMVVLYPRTGDEAAPQYESRTGPETAA